MISKYIINKICAGIGTVGVCSAVLMYQSKTFADVPTFPFLGLSASSWILCKICYGEILNIHAQDARELESFIKAHFRRVTFIEETIKSGKDNGIIIN